MQPTSPFKRICRHRDLSVFDVLRKLTQLDDIWEWAVAYVSQIISHAEKNEGQKKKICLVSFTFLSISVATSMVLKMRLIGITRYLGAFPPKQPWVEKSKCNECLSQSGIKNLTIYGGKFHIVNYALSRIVQTPAELRVSIVDILIVDFTCGFYSSYSSDATFARF